MEGNKRFKTVQGSNRANTEKRQRNLVNKLKSLKKKKITEKVFRIRN